MSDNRVPISAVVITLNEEHNIERCLQHLSFCKEIIVVDSGSRDGTVELAKRYTDKVFSVPWEGFAAQKNKAIEAASYKWVLSVDADEVVTADLQVEIRKLFRAGDPVLIACYSIPRKTLHFGRWIKHGGWYPNRLVRLFDKTRGKWEGEELHEKWVSTGVTGELQQDLEHHSFENLADQVNRNNRYSSLGAAKLQRQGNRFASFRLFTKPLSKFVETYVVKRGFLDGYPGFIISISAAYSVFLKWAKLWELEHAPEER